VTIELDPNPSLITPDEQVWLIAKSLEGTWRPDLLFVLQQEVAMHDAYHHRITECDQALERHLKADGASLQGATYDAATLTPSS
jgi:hypothetical protein